MYYFGLLTPLGLLASFVARNLALQRGLNERRWAFVCLVFFPALIALAFAKPRIRAGDTAAFRDRWTSLAAYDPDIKAAVERLSTLGPSAIEEFRRAYADVQTQVAVPAIVVDLEARWAAGDRFDGTHAEAERLAALHRQGRLSDRKYAAKTKRLRAWTLQRPWAGWWWQLPMVFVAMWVLWPKQAVAFLTCDAGGARELVRQAIVNADDGRQVTRLLALDGVRELSFNASRRDRSCTGTAVLNTGQRQIYWRMYARGDSVVVDVSGF